MLMVCPRTEKTTVVRKKNPGNNVKGQPCRARVHHTGKFSTEYVEDRTERSAKLRVRSEGIIKKVSYLYYTHR